MILFKPKDASFSFGTSSSPPCQALSHVLLLLLLRNTHGNNNWWSRCRGSHLPGVFFEQQSISHLSPVYASYPLDPCSGEFHCWFGCWQPFLSLALKLCLSPQPGTCCSKAPSSEEPARHMASDHTLSFLGSFLELLKQSSGCLNYASPFGPLLMRSVQVSFIPGSEMLPFSRKTSDPVGRPVVFQQQIWDKLLLGPACSPGFSPDVLCTCELLSSP